MQTIAQAAADVIRVMTSTFKDCPNCGGTHYGSIECPYLEKNMGEPCTVCGERTCYCCSDCRLDGAGKVYVCVMDPCRTEHEKKHAAAGNKSARELRNLAGLLEARGSVGAVVCTVAANEIERLQELADDLKRQRDDNYKFLCEKDQAMGMVLDRLRNAGVGFSDLIP